MNLRSLPWQWKALSFIGGGSSCPPSLMNLSDIFPSSMGKMRSFFVICDTYSDSIVGFVSLTGIEREPYHRGRLGYGVFERYARMGYVSAGFKQVIDFAFESLKLHRLEADIQPENSPSRRLVEKMGFTCEGVSRGFIRINGEWIDHERWALTPDD